MLRKVLEIIFSLLLLGTTGQTFAQYSEVDERYVLTGTISDNLGSKRSTNIAVIFDKVKEKNLVVRSGEKLPGNKQWTVIEVKAKTATLEDSFSKKKVVLHKETFESSSSVATNSSPSGSRRNLEPEMAEEELEVENIAPPGLGNGPMHRRDRYRNYPPRSNPPPDELYMEGRAPESYQEDYVPPQVYDDEMHEEYFVPRR